MSNFLFAGFFFSGRFRKMEEPPITTQLELAAILIYLARKPRVWRRMDNVLLQAFRKDRPYWDDEDDLKSAWSNLPLVDKKAFVDDYAETISKALGAALNVCADDAELVLDAGRDIEFEDQSDSEL